METSGGIGSKQGSKRRRLDERAWRELLERFDGGGLTVEAFCKDEGLSRSSFNRWRSRLPMPGGGAATVVHEPDEPHRREVAPTFVDLGLLGAASAASPANLELRLELGGGLSLTLVRR